MATRPIWKGQIRLSLVSIPVEIFSATRSGATVSFRQIDRKSGKRIHYEKVVEGGKPVGEDDIVKGYEVAKDDYVILTDEEIEGVKLDTKKTLELVQFVEQSEIPPLFYDKPYYVVPQDELAEDAYRVVRDALRRSGKTGLGQLSMRGREYLVALRPCGKGLLLETLHYADEVRKADATFEDISPKKADDELLAVAGELIARKSGPFQAKAFKNHYVEALKRLIAEKQESDGETPIVEDDGEAPPRAGKSNVVDLMAALKKSLSGGGRAPADDAEDGEAVTRKPAAKRRSSAASPSSAPSPRAKPAAKTKRGTGKAGRAAPKRRSA